jgi:hypothetical protein
VDELAQEAVTGQSKYSGSELLELARFRIASKAPHRVSSNKLNTFNIFQQEMKRDQNLELRTGRPAPGTAGINKGRPVFTGAYQKDLAEKYKSRQAEFQHQAKERNDAPPDKVEERLGPEGASKVNRRPTRFRESCRAMELTTSS